MKEITLNVCQGVGDIFWVYQKFSPHVDKINFNIAALPGLDRDDNRANALRAIPFLQLLPKVSKIDYVIIPPEHYDRIANGYFSMIPIMKELENVDMVGPVDYACNRVLEDGLRIEDIDPYDMEETVNIRTEPCPLEFKEGEYIALYVSGGMRYKHVVDVVGAWNLKDWVDFVVTFYKKYNLEYPIIIIGASYDRDLAQTLESVLRAKKFRTKIYIDAWSANVMYILKNSVCYLGYQSGLNILADNIDVKQVMLYFKHLHRMQYAWCKKNNIDNHTFNAALFSSSPYEVVDNLCLKFI